MTQCKCGSRPREGAPSYSMLRFGDLAGPKALKAWGLKFRIPINPQSPIFLASTDEFCRNPPSASHGGGGAIDVLLNRAIDGLWHKNCRCRREVGVLDLRYVIKHKVVLPGQPLPQDRVYSGQAFITEPVHSLSFGSDVGFGGQELYRLFVTFGIPPVDSRLAGVLVFDFTDPRGQILSMKRVSFTCPKDEGGPQGVEPPPTPLPLPAPIISFPYPPPLDADQREKDKIVGGYPPPGDDDCCCCC